MAGKARYWCAICYPENMINTWAEDMGDLLQIPYAYCVHDKDKLEDDPEKRKTHVHIMLAFNNTTTQKHAMEVIMSLSKPGSRCCSTIEQVFDVRHMYDYLIHNTDSAKKKGKFQYKANERKTGNNFDIGSFEQLSVAEKDKICEEIEDIIIKEQFYNFTDLLMNLKSNYDRSYVTVLRSQSGYFERIIKGCFHKKQVSIKKFKKSSR